MRIIHFAKQVGLKPPMFGGYRQPICAPACGRKPDSWTGTAHRSNVTCKLCKRVMKTTQQDKQDG